MSAKLMGQVWELKLPPNQQNVLLALADHAHDDGTRCFPGVPYLAWKTGYSQRNVQMILRQLEADEIIEPVAGEHGGRGHRTEYHIHINNGVRKPPYRAPKGEMIAPFNPCQRVKDFHPLDGVKGEKSDTERVKNPALKGEKSRTENTSAYKERGRVNHHKNHHNEPSIESGGVCNNLARGREAQGNTPPPPDGLQQKSQTTSSQTKNFQNSAFSPPADVVDAKALLGLCCVNVSRPAERDREQWPGAIATVREALPDASPEERAAAIGEFGRRWASEGRRSPYLSQIAGHWARVMAAPPEDNHKNHNGGNSLERTRNERILRARAAQQRAYGRK